MERPEVTGALYRSVVEIDNKALIASFARRVDGATIAMLHSASDATFRDLETVNPTLLTVIFGTVRNAFERELSPAAADGLQRQLTLMCTSYLKAASASRNVVDARHENVERRAENVALR